MIIGHIEQFPLFFTVFLPISLFLLTTADTPALWIGSRERCSMGTRFLNKIGFCRAIWDAAR
jgi:hypothetical protein